MLAVLTAPCVATPPITQRPLLKMDRIEALAGMGGVRIEDDVAILGSGHAAGASFNLTEAAGCAKDADAIEAAMARR